MNMSMWVVVGAGVLSSVGIGLTFLGLAVIGAARDQPSDRMKAEQ